MKKKPVLGIFLMIFGLLIAILGVLIGVVATASSLFSVLGQFMADDSVNAYYSYVEPYVNIVKNIPLVEQVVNTVNGYNNSSWILLIADVVCIVGAFILGAIGKKCGGLVINIFANIINILSILVLIVAAAVFFLSLNYPAVRDLIMSLIVKTKA